VIVLDQWALLSFSPAQEYYWVKLFTLLGWAPTLQGGLTIDASTFQNLTHERPRNYSPWQTAAAPDGGGLERRAGVGRRQGKYATWLVW
jgi:hypothetical protein